MAHRLTGRGRLAAIALSVALAGLALSEPIGAEPGGTEPGGADAPAVTKGPADADRPAGTGDRPPENSRRLIGEQIRQALTGRTLFGYNTASGISWIEYYAPDGTAIYRMNGAVMVGIWEVVDDRICFAYDNGEPPDTHMFRMFRATDRFFFTAVDRLGRERLSAIGLRLQDGRADRLDNPERHGLSIDALRRTLTCLAARTS